MYASRFAKHELSSQATQGRAGEPITITTAPAIAIAIYNAVGVRIRDVPFQSQKIRSLLSLQEAT